MEKHLGMLIHLFQCSFPPSFVRTSLSSVADPAARREANSSHVADAWITPLTNLQPPSASGGNMYLQRSQRTPGSGAGR
jgi:hypothetical protein